MAKPKHVAIIMDGNGRWARERGMPRWRGHEEGAGAVRRATEAACRMRIPVLTLFTFSSENWRRPAKEVEILFGLFRRYLINERDALLENGIRLSALGRRDRLPAAALEALCETEAVTARCRRLHLRLALDYGARDEIARAARMLAEQAEKGLLRAFQIDEERFAQTLTPPDVPDPDLVIRTAGERRLSNFLLWQAAYAELYFCPKLWPDFQEEDLAEAVADYSKRERRFGGLIKATAGIG